MSVNDVYFKLEENLSVSQLIKHLQKIKKDFGDLPVKVDPKGYENDESSFPKGSFVIKDPFEDKQVLLLISS